MVNQELINKCFPEQSESERSALAKIFSCDSELNAAGYPIVDQTAFHLMRDELDLLFKPGSALIDGAELLLQQNEVPESGLIVARVLQTVVRTANITAPSDLWVMRLMLDAHLKLGIVQALSDRRCISIQTLAHSLKLDAAYLEHDIRFLMCRGYVVKTPTGLTWSEAPQVKSMIADMKLLLDLKTINFVPEMVDLLRDKKVPVKATMDFFRVEAPARESRAGWAPTARELEIGMRVVPIVLALRILGHTSQATAGKPIGVELPAELLLWLKAAGYLNESATVTTLGERVLQRGPGPFGIIHAYYSYFDFHDRLLRGDREGFWVARGENVAASQDANAKTFRAANDNLDRFCKDTNFSFSVFIEHAVGQGEATRQRFERSGEKAVRYIGADLEQAAIDQALLAQQRGELPQGMAFVSGADIGEPQILIDALADQGVEASGAVMMVGNGFHEVRNQTNERMVEVFEGYCKAGIILIFTEESGLRDDDLLETAWNTYHAGFRYVHAISGQGLRPAIDREDLPGARYSWIKCATLAGYKVLDDYCFRTRRIYPHPKKSGYNPAISVTYFCVPADLKK